MQKIDLEHEYANSQKSKMKNMPSDDTWVMIRGSICSTLSFLMTLTALRTAPTDMTVWSVSANMWSCIAVVPYKTRMHKLVGAEFFQQEIQS